MGDRAQRTPLTEDMKLKIKLEQNQRQIFTMTQQQQENYFQLLHLISAGGSDLPGNYLNDIVREVISTL